MRSVVFVFLYLCLWGFSHAVKSECSKDGECKQAWLDKFEDIIATKSKSITSAIQLRGIEVSRHEDNIAAALEANKPILLVSAEEEHKKNAFYEHGFYPHNDSLFTFVQPWTTRAGTRSYKIVELGVPLYGGGIAQPVSADDFDPDDSDKSHGSIAPAVAGDHPFVAEVQNIIQHCETADSCTKYFEAATQQNLIPPNPKAAYSVYSYSHWDYFYTPAWSDPGIPQQTTSFNSVQNVYAYFQTSGQIQVLQIIQVHTTPSPIVESKRIGFILAAVKPKLSFTPQDSSTYQRVDFSPRSPDYGGSTVTNSWSSDLRIPTDLNGCSYTTSIQFQPSFQNSPVSIQDWTFSIDNAKDYIGWQFWQTKPIDKMTHTVDTFGSNWPDYYDPDWCTCTPQSALGSSTFTTDSSAVYSVSAGSCRTPPSSTQWFTSKYTTEFRPSAFICDNYNGHHQLWEPYSAAPVSSGFSVNLASTWVPR